MSFHYARLTRDFENSDVDGPEVFHFVAIEGDDDWVEVQIEEPLRPEHEPELREMIEDHLSETVTCRECKAQAGSFDALEHDPDCTEEGEVSGFLPMRITRRFLRLQGADFVKIG